MKTDISLDIRNDDDYSKTQYVQLNIRLLKSLTGEDYTTIRQIIQALEKIANNYIRG